MIDTQDTPATGEELFVIRMYDAEAKDWTTLTEPMSGDEAAERYNEFTANGTSDTGENDEPYYYEIYEFKPKRERADE